MASVVGISRWLAAAAFAVAALALSVSAGAQPADAFYKGKTVQVIVGYPPGGGFDLYARLLTDYMGRHLPGNPTLILQHMPGADSVKMANFVYAVGPQDGTVIGLPIHTLVLNEVLWKDEGGQFKIAKFNWIGRLDAIDLTMLAWHTAGIKTIEDVKRKELIIGSTSIRGTVAMVPTALNRLIGTKFKLVQGYTGTREQMLAVERGEVQGMGNAPWSTLKITNPDWVPDHKAYLLYLIGLKRAPDLPDVPTIVELAPNEESRKVLQLLASTSEMGRSFMVGPQVPAERVALLRKAFMETASDPALLDDAAKRQVNLNPMSGEQLQSLITEVTSYPESLYERTRALVTP
ncbi:MAG: Bug family tripartite tricarboxylate transporter substrate binding protein [Gemmatimonas sp.]